MLLRLALANLIQLWETNKLSLIYLSNIIGRANKFRMVLIYDISRGNSLALLRSFSDKITDECMDFLIPASFGFGIN